MSLRKPRSTSSEHGENGTRAAQDVGRLDRDAVARRTAPPRSLKQPEASDLPDYPPVSTRPKLTPSQTSFVALALVGALVTGIFLFTSLAGPQRILDEEAFSDLKEDGGPAAGAATKGPGRAEITVLTDPVAATVAVDFDPVGTTPMQPIALVDGMYFLTVSKPGYVTVDTLVTVRAGEEPFFWFTLQPYGPPLDEPQPDRSPELFPTFARQQTESTPSEGVTTVAPPTVRPSERTSDGAPSERRDLVSAPSQPPSDEDREDNAASAEDTDAEDTDRPVASGEARDESTTPRTERANQVADPNQPADPGLEADREATPDALDTPAEPETFEEAVGTLAVLVRPWGAIYVDGVLHSSNTDVLYSVDVAPGEHVVRAVHPTLGEVTRTVFVDPSSTRRVVLNLDRQNR